MSLEVKRACPALAGCRVAGCGGEAGQGALDGRPSRGSRCRWDERPPVSEADERPLEGRALSVEGSGGYCRLSLSPYCCGDGLFEQRWSNDASSLEA